MPSQLLPKQVSIPKFNEIVLYTGNVMLNTMTASKSWNKKSNTELVQAISDTLDISLHGSEVPSFRYFSEQGLLEVPDVRLSSRIHPDHRSEVEVTAKLFYLDNQTEEYQASHIDKAIYHLQQLLDVKSIDTFLVSFNSNETTDSIDKAWKDLEIYNEKGVISKLGLCDFNVDKLRAFMNKPNLKVKPSINQIYVDQCCSLPQDLIQLGKSKNIEITYNGDKTEILTTEVLSNLLKSQYVINENTQVTPRWVLKYNVFYKNRGVVADKGYIVVGDVLPSILDFQ